MCLIVFSWKSDPQHKLILVANRDEFFKRPTEPARFYDHILAGKDLQCGGTWLGVSRKGKVAAITNFRDPHDEKKPLRSRGMLVCNFLASKCSANDYIEQISTQKEAYNPFNLLLYDGQMLICYSSKTNEVVNVEPGIHALSNHHLDSNWPKVSRVKKSFSRLLETGDNHYPEDYMEIMKDSTPAKDNELPNTGVSLEWEHKLSPIFIKGSDYGTRSTSVLLIKQNNEAHFTERSYYADKESAITCHESFMFGI